MNYVCSSSISTNNFCPKMPMYIFNASNSTGDCISMKCYRLLKSQYLFIALKMHNILTHAKFAPVWDRCGSLHLHVYIYMTDFVFIISHHTVL